MPRRSDPAHSRLVALARAQACPDPDLAACWDLVVQGLEGRFFGAAQLEPIARVLELGSGIGFDEVGFDAEGDEAAVWFVREQRRCSRDRLIAALRALLRRAAASP